MDEITAYLPGLSPVENKELCVRFDGGRLSSDGGVLVLREIEKRLGLAARLAGCLSDARDPASTSPVFWRHLRQRSTPGCLCCGFMKTLRLWAMAAATTQCAATPGPGVGGGGCCRRRRVLCR